MTEKEYKSKTGQWFRGKEAKVNISIKNNGGGIIPQGDTVVISGKSGRGGFNIMSRTNGISINGVNYEFIDFNFLNPTNP